MKEPVSMRQAYTTSRDLDVVLEENETNVSMSQQTMNYLDQVLDPALSNPLSFLRNAHTKAATASSPVFHHPDIPVTSAIDSGRTPLPARRARAGTMPSMMMHLPDERSHRSPLLRPSAAAAATAAAAAAAAADTRHRSGSLNLPVPPPLNLFGSTWATMEGSQQLVRSSLPSPATEQLLRGDRDSSIARTMRSLGLEDEENNNPLYHHHHHHHHHHLSLQERVTNVSTPSVSIAVAPPQPPPEISLPTGRSLLSGNRIRSYSVNATTRYQDRANPPIPMPLPLPNVSANITSVPVVAAAATAATALNPAPLPPSAVPTQVRTTRARASTFANPLDSLTVQRNRPRASSMSRMDYDRSMNTAMPSSLWQMQLPVLETLHDEDSHSGFVEHDYNKQSEPPLSLGDSELLANMLHTQQSYGENIVMEQQQQQQQLHPEPPIYMNGNTATEPYLHISQSTPTFRNQQAQLVPSTSSPSQTATRSLWIGNIDSSVNSDNLNLLFSAYGPIESIRLLSEKECAFVNFFHVEDAIRAKEEVLGRLGGRVGNCVVRIGYGRADAAIPDTTALQPTRALWLGNIPTGVTPSTLQHIFSSFGTIESVRVLSHKNCGFINFESVDSASHARDALLQNEGGFQSFAGVRVGFAKVPPAKASTSELVAANSNAANNVSMSPKASTEGNNNVASTSDRASLDDSESWLADLWCIMKQYGADENTLALVKALESSSGYFESIPPVPEFGANRKFDAARLRDVRKKLDNANHGSKEVETIALDCMDEIAELSSDYIGNTVVQRLFEKCTEETKTNMLKRIGPHMAAISVHKNGTWAAQKIIDTIKTPEQIHIVCSFLRPYVPPLLLDQFGNYAVQCCLRLGDRDNQFIFDAMVEKLLNIAQGRFGARAMRGILDNTYVTMEKKFLVAAALSQNAMSLTMNANGVLLLSWLVDSSEITQRYVVLAKTLAPHVVQLGTHKLGSQMLIKIISQENEPVARHIVLDALSKETNLQEILMDQVRGVPLISKVLACPTMSTAERDTLIGLTRHVLSRLQGPAQKKLLDDLDTGAGSSGTDDSITTTEASERGQLSPPPSS